MPNYVYSTLGLEGSKESIKIFREKFEEEGRLLATRVIPYPRELELLDKRSNEGKLTEDEEKELTLLSLEGKYDMDKDGYNQGGYDWCIKNWGTKWGFCDCVVDEEEEDYILYSFSTAWSPITLLIAEMSRQFPDITFIYFCDEESGEFRYEETYEGGVSTDYDDRSYEIEEERRQEEADYKLEQERDKQIESKGEK